MPIVRHIIADQFGSYLGKFSQRLRLTLKKQLLAQAPIMHLESVTIASRGVSVSADALAACCAAGIPVFFVDEGGTPFASLYAAGLTGTVHTRREQVRAYDDARGFALACAFALGKISNQAATLRYLARTRTDDAVCAELRLVAGELQNIEVQINALAPDHVDNVRSVIMAIEAHAARQYWAAARLVVPQQYGWAARITRGATDPINSLLNYGYGILYRQVERALVLAGLDPFAGFVHADRPGKPSLVLDMVEEFRQPVVDREVMGLAGVHFSVDQDEQGLLDVAVRRTFAEHVHKHLAAKVRYDGARHTLANVIQMQARLLAAYLRGERDAYTPYKAEG